MTVDLAGANWFKSTRSSGTKACVEVAFVDNAVGVRDSKNPTGPALAIAPEAWDAFTSHLREGVRP